MERQKLEPTETYKVGDSVYNMRGSVGNLCALEDKFNLCMGDVLLGMEKFKISQLADAYLCLTEGDAPNKADLQEAIVNNGYGDMRGMLYTFILLCLLPQGQREEAQKKLKPLAKS